ncbi:hypothetical protein CJF32_00002328 [Rutstroemia sp. NJR-2017a WRK4]|nr:hypothetical protein CJF32_00002231 [Rutstroemia sp. NJR-2017a WRK4]PQE14789.1 hypothetical protein CJF32_00002328 [Rutstroemia sp. NJR-2017a WRK4]
MFGWSNISYLLSDMLELSIMGQLKYSYKLLALLTIFHLCSAQLISSLPSCIQDCVTSSPDDNCDVTDIGCICRASRGNFLPDVITCMHSTCDGNLDVNLLLTPLQLACQIAGAAIPAAALRNAENEASSLATQVTTTVTVGGSFTTATSLQTITTDAQNPPSVSSVTITSTQSGSTVYVVYPITIGSTTTETAAPSTLTLQQTFTSLIPVVIIGNDGSGSSYTSTTTRVLALSTLTTTNSEGSTVAKTSTYTEATTATARASGSGSGSLAGGVTTITETVSGTSVAAQETTSSGDESGSKTSSASSSKNTSPDSAPFTDTNDVGSLGKRENVRLVMLAVLAGFMTVMMVWV